MLSAAVVLADDKRQTFIIIKIELCLLQMLLTLALAATVCFLVELSLLSWILVLYAYSCLHALTELALCKICFAHACRSAWVVLSTHVDQIW